MEIEPEKQKEVKSSIQENNILIPEENTIEEEPSLDIFKEIFIFIQSDNKIIYSPILANSKNLNEKLLFIFNKPKIESMQDISNSINLLTKIIEIINNSYEIMHIIMNFLSKNDIDPIKNVVDIYIFLITSKKQDKNKYENDIKKILNWFLIGGLFNKNHTDYIFQTLSKIQLEKKLTPALFNDYLFLIELIYG